MNDTATPAGVSKLAGLTFLATALGIPSATIAFFKDEVAELPVEAKVALFGLWGGLTVLSALWAEVWKHLKGVWGKRLADWIDVRVRTWFSRYRRRYLEFLYYQHRDFDVKGLSTHGPYNLELEDVF
ncbi:MAG: hypothetical protein GY856_03160, partial [bacterium]|nr:hypothetical protein [bacterium]